MKEGHGLVAGLLLAMAPLFPGGSSGAAGQEPPVRTLSREESRALETWARHLLADLPEASASAGEPSFQERETRRLWALYFLAVDHPRRLDEAREAAEALVGSGSAPEQRGIVEALAGALEVIRAKHSRWPPNKLKYLDAGITALDDLVARYPKAPGIRYLRLVSCYYLPFFLERGETVAEDFRALSHLLLEGPGVLPGPVFTAAKEFVMENGGLDAETRKRLQEALE